MKIAIFSDCYLDLTGGIIQVINSQKAELEKLGHTVYVFSTGYPRTPEERQKLAKKHIFQAPSCRLFFRGLTPVSRRPRIIERWLLKYHPELRDFDIFYIHYEGGCSIAGLRLARELHIPSVQMMHGREDVGEANIIPRGFRTIVAQALNRFHSWYLPHPIKIRPDDYLARTTAATKMWELMVNHANFADVVVTPSNHFRKKLKHYGVTRPIQVIPNSYPDHLFPTQVSVKKLAPGQPLRMLWHSRLSPEKRILPFLEALTLLPDSSKFTLDIYGDGPDYFKAQKYVAQHHLPVKFHGNVKFEKLAKALLDSHLDIMASYNYDTFGMTLIEAEAYGTPVFICDPDMREVVPAGSYILSTPEAPEAMAAALADLLTHPERITQMSSAMLTHRPDILTSHRIQPLLALFNSLAKN